MTTQEKRLTRSTHDRMIAGVCGGLADYFDIDATILRLAVVLLTVFTTVFPGVLLYVIMWLVMPEEGEQPSTPSV